ncbi:MAG: PilN domain-containing protein [Gallionella sp.]
MIRVNLLPHREEKRQARHIQFIALSVISLILGGLIVLSVQVVFNNKISYQERRNSYLKAETVILDKQIAQINKLRKEIKSLLARKNVVEELQGTRSDVVHLLDQMLRILPEGVYLKTLKQKGSSISLVGYTQSSARVSTLMRAIENSPWLDTPTLREIHAVTVRAKRGQAGGGRMNQFSLSFNLTKLKDEVKPVGSGGKRTAKKR